MLRCQRMKLHGRHRLPFEACGSQMVRGTAELSFSSRKRGRARRPNAKVSGLAVTRNAADRLTGPPALPDADGRLRVLPAAIQPPLVHAVEH